MGGVTYHNLSSASLQVHLASPTFLCFAYPRRREIELVVFGHHKNEFPCQCIDSLLAVHRSLHKQM